MKIKKVFLFFLILSLSFSFIACNKNKNKEKEKEETPVEETITVTLAGEKTVAVGAQITLTPTVSANGATLTWTTSNAAVATVANGVVTGVSAGKATITVEAAVGSKKANASLEVTVTENKTNNSPVISGAADKVIEKGSTFVPLEGITASDVEDGDLTSKIKYKGNVRPGAVGEYEATYSVTDNDNNTTTVTIKVTVIFNDNDAPLLTGVSDATIIVGDTSFDALRGVAAQDAVDGDVSNKIQVTGAVNPWVLGEYELSYSVKDNSENAATAKRIVTVTLGEFKIAELEAKEFVKVENNYKFDVALAEINTALASFAVGKLTFKVNAAAACEIVPSITNGAAQEKIALVAGDNEVTVYFRVNAAIEAGEVVLAAPADATLTFTEAKFAFGEAKDTTLPEITVPAEEIVLPGSVTDLAALKSFILNGVSAVDNVDGIITSKLDVDFTGIEVGNVFEEKEVTIFVVDSSDNRAEAKRTVKFVKVYDTKLISDPEFNTMPEAYDEETHIGWGLNGGSGEPEIYIAEGALVHHNKTTANPGWDSASSPFYRNTTENIEPYNWYMLKFDVKAEVARKMTVRIGLETTEALGWIENFSGANNTPFNITTDWQTCYVLFYVHAAKSQGNQNTVKIELKIGTYTWGSEEQGNTVYFDNLQIYLLTNENTAPKLTVNKDLPTTFGKGEAKPDLTKYVAAHDLEDAADIEITAANITEAIDMATAGTYDVKYTVADSEGKESTVTIKIKVLEEKDTVAPVLAEAAGAVKEFDQNSEGADLTKLITATDAVDGDIVITKDMIETDADISKAGTYEVKYTVKDSSGNVATLTITVVVNDKEAPVISGKDSIKTTAGKALSAADIIATLTAKDNVDGAITLTADMVKDLDKVDFNTVGEYAIVVAVSDAAGNVNNFAMTVVVKAASGKVKALDQKVVDLADTAMTSTTDITITKEGDEYTVTMPSTIGPWASSQEVKITGMALTDGETYALKVTAKADSPRKVQAKLGIGLWVDPWFDLYTLLDDADGVFDLTTEYKDYVLYFKADKANTAAGPTIEFCMGLIGGENETPENKVYFKEFAIYSVKEVGAETATEVQNFLDNDYTGESCDVAKTDDVLTINPTDVGGWASVAKIKILDLATEDGKTYELRITAKADEARQVQLNIGIALWADPWYDKFTLAEADSNMLLLGTEYQEYVIRFVADKSTRDSGPAIEFCVGNTGNAGDKVGNVIYVNSFKLYEIEEAPGETLTEVQNFLDLDLTGETCDVAKVDDVLTINPTDVGGWASVAKIKITGMEVEEGKTYELKLVAKADEARQIQLNVGIALWADPWYDKFTLAEEGTDLILLGTEYAEYVIRFVADKSTRDSGPAIEFCVGNTYHAGDKVGNVIYVSSFKLYEVEVEEDDDDEPSTKPIVLDDFEDYADQDALAANWAKRYDSVNYSEGFEVVDVEGNKVVKFNYASDKKYLLRWIGEFPALTDDYKYVRFKAQFPEVEGLKVEVWFYWSGSQNGINYTPADIYCAKDGYYYVAMKDFGKTGSAMIGFAIGFNYKGGEVAYFDDIEFVCDKPDAEKPVITVSTEVQAMVANGLKFDAGTDLTQQFAALRAGLSATDNVDGEIEITDDMINFGGLNVACAYAGKFTVKVTVKDAAGNIAEVSLPVEIVGADGLVLDILHRGLTGENATVEEVEDGLALDPTAVGEWASYAKCKITDLGLEYGKTYELRITAKADEARQVQFNIGIGLWADPWYDKFTLSNDATGLVTFGTEYAEYVIKFVYDKETRDGGPAIEFCIGNTGNAGDKAGNVITVKAFEIYEVEADPEVDVTAPVISISDMVKLALATKEFKQGADETATFNTLLAGITINDDFDGAITVTNDMIDLGGLNPALLIAGDYVITITATDETGNIGKLELPLHVSKLADVTFFTDGVVGSSYANANWKQEKYTTEWTTQSGQMNCREKDGVKVVNFVSGYSYAYRYTYTVDGGLGVANKLTLKVGNYFGGADVIGIKLILIDVKGNYVYLEGDSDNFVDFPVTTGLVDKEYTFDAVDVKSLMVVCKSALNTSAYLYVGDMNLTNTAVNKVPAEAGYDKVVDASLAGTEVNAKVTVGGVDLTYGLNAFSKLSDALAFAKDGETIKVLAGTYAEDLAVAKSVKLVGPNAGVLGGSASRVAEAIISGKIVVSADNVTIDGFTMKNETVFPKDAVVKNFKYLNNNLEEYAGEGFVNSYGSNSGNAIATLENVEISGNYAVDFAGARGFRLAIVNGITFKDNYIVGAAGKLFSPFRVDTCLYGECLFENNYFENTQQDGFTIQGVGAMNATFIGNTFKDIASTCIDTRNMKTNAPGNVVINVINNTFDHAGYGWIPVRPRTANYGDYTLTVNVNYNAFLNGSYYLEGTVKQFVEEPTAGKVVYNVDHNYFEGVLAADLTAANFCNAASSWANCYDSLEDLKIGYDQYLNPADQTAPVITVSESVLTALASKTFMEGDDESATFAALLAGISATDETDGDITVTQENVDLGGLNPANLVAGNYTITITVKDAANNEAKKELAIHVAKYADLTLDFMDGTVGSGYTNAKWTQEVYNTSWTAQTGKMNCREKDGVRVVNFYSGYSMSYRYTYTDNIGIANKLTFKVGNYYDGAQAFSVKVILVDAAGVSHYILGDASTFASIPVTTGLVDQELTFDAVDAQAFVIVAKSAISGNAYLYVGDINFDYVEAE